MNNDLFKGKLVRLAPQDPDSDPAIVASWGKDTAYTRLLDVDPVTPPQVKHWEERFKEPSRDGFYQFSVRTLDTDTLIGFVVLMRVNHMHGDAYVGIGMGDADYRSKGYGTDTMRVVLRYAFTELNLHRVSLDAVATNARAVRSYEKAGFVLEGQTRGTEYRNRKHDNLVSMGILKCEWQALREQTK